MEPLHEVRYLLLAEVIALHEAVSERTGFAPAPLRDEGRLEAAIVRPRMAAYYENADVVRQCALLAVGICQAQAFLDGNKRTALAAADVFLRVNGLKIRSESLAVGQQLEAITMRSETLDEATRRFEGWLRAKVVPIEPIDGYAG